ncbi:MAG: Phosphoenolpyruvate-dependent sugar phosphotransferase system, 2, partial [Pseudomonadota bacterium]
PVELLFTLLVPENATQKHLDILAEIAELLGDESKRNSLKAAADLESFLAIVHAGTLL